MISRSLALALAFSDCHISANAAAAAAAAAAVVVDCLAFLHVRGRHFFCLLQVSSIVISFFNRPGLFVLSHLLDRMLFTQPEQFPLR